MPAATATKIYLTPEEQGLLKKLPAASQEWFKGYEAETLTSYESEDELLERMGNASYDKYPEVKDMMGKFSKSGNIEDLNMEKLSDGAMDVLLFTIGACGICALIEISLQMDDLNADGVAAIGTLSMARHRILTINSSK